MAIDTNSILSGYISNYSTFSSTDSRDTVEKVLKYSGREFDIRKRGDIKTEVVVMKARSGNTDYLLGADKPDELIRNFEALIYVEQSDKQSTKEKRYERLLDLQDQLIDWSLQVTASDVDSELYTITFTDVGDVNEEDGYLSTNVNFKSIIKLS